MRWEPRRKSCGLDYKPLENPYRLTVGRSNLPALRFRYTEENVTREPARMTMYANGTASPHQSISNMMVSSLVSGICFSSGWYGEGYSKLSLSSMKKGVKYLFKVTVARVAAPAPLSLPIPAPPGWRNTTTDTVGRQTYLG